MLARSFQSMAQVSAAPTFKAFNLALIQLGGVTANKADNLKHAREMILRAAVGDGGSKAKPNVIVLPVCIFW
jgi:omega-amidase